MELFLIYSDYFFAENILTSTRCKRKSVKYPAVIHAFALWFYDNRDNRDNV